MTRLAPRTRDMAARAALLYLDPEATTGQWAQLVTGAMVATRQQRAAVDAMHRAWVARRDAVKPYIG